jgi:hypothetical protein
VTKLQEPFPAKYFLIVRLPYELPPALWFSVKVYDVCHLYSFVRRTKYFQFASSMKAPEESLEQETATYFEFMPNNSIHSISVR